MPHDSVIQRRGVASGALPAGLRSSADAAATHLGVSRTVSREPERPISHPRCDLTAPPTATAQRYGAVATASHADNEDAAERGMPATRRHAARRRVGQRQTSRSATPGTAGAVRWPARPETADVALPHHRNDHADPSGDNP